MRIFILLRSTPGKANLAVKPVGDTCSSVISPSLSATAPNDAGKTICR